MYLRSKIWAARMAFGRAGFAGQGSSRTRLGAPDRGEPGKWAPAHSRDQELAHAEADPGVVRR